jgi:dihydropteroate synthase
MEHNLSLLRHLPELVAAAAGAGCAGVAGRDQPQALHRAAGAGPPGAEEPAGVEDRLEGSLATAAQAMVAGGGMVRVHDVAATVQAARLYGPAA